MLLNQFINMYFGKRICMYSIRSTDDSFDEYLLSLINFHSKYDDVISHTKELNDLYVESFTFDVSCDGIWLVIWVKKGAM